MECTSNGAFRHVDPVFRVVFRLQPEAAAGVVGRAAPDRHPVSSNVVAAKALTHRVMPLFVHSGDEVLRLASGPKLDLLTAQQQVDRGLGVLARKDSVGPRFENLVNAHDLAHGVLPAARL